MALFGSASFTLPGEAYDGPGISPNGANAIWPHRGGWLTSTAAGFTLVERELPNQESTTTGTVQAEYYERPTSYWFQGRERGFTLVVSPRRGSWKIRRTVY